jgi:hypothetical protein
MDARFYNSEEIDIERLANDVINIYMAQAYQTQQIGSRDQVLVQIKKGGDFEAILGMQAAVSLTIQRTAGGILAMIGQQRWLDKAAVGTIGIVAFPVLWPLALTAGAGALRQASLGNQVLNVVDGLVRQQHPGIQIGPVPVQIMPQIQQQWGQPPYQPYQQQAPYYAPSQTIVSQAPMPSLPSPTALRCPNCNTPYEAGDTFCSGCGRSLTPPKVYCTNCNTELKPGIGFCPKCGTSTYQAFATAAQKAQPQSAQPTQTAPSYTPPTPPVQQTPPAAPKQEIYYVPSMQQAPPPAPEPYTPTVAQQPVRPTPPTPKPEPEIRYVPPMTQNPSVVPQPKVTIVPSAPKQEPSAPTKQPKQEVYYVPSTQQTPAQAPAVSNAAAPSQPIAAKPSSQPVIDATAPWGALTFTDGKQVQLKGERALVGRFDHDLGGIQPEVDLGPMQGADTVSRIHAALEHIGSTYTLTDLNSTNSTRINGKRLEPDKATPINDGDTLYFGKVTCTFKKA